MHRTTLLATIISIAATIARADYAVKDHGDWPRTWPAELEPLRKAARTFEGPMIEFLQYEIPFIKRNEFEDAWPHILKVKTAGAPIFIVKSPMPYLFKLKAGVVIHSPPRNTDKKEEPLAKGGERERWAYTNYIILVVDGDIVDLNRIPLPADTPIVDERFKQQKQ